MPLNICLRADDAEKHEFDITTLLFLDDKLYSAGDDGKIKLWGDDLKLIKETQAHPCSIYSLAVGNGTLYSCSNDGTVRSWGLDLKPSALIFQDESEMYKVCFRNGKLFVGDSVGLVRIFEHDNLIGILEIGHPIVELLVINNFIYTARDLYVIISEVTHEGRRIATIKATQGRAPVCISGDRLCFTSRSGKDLLVHKNQTQYDFEFVASVKDAHELIISALCGLEVSNNKYLYTGGWDKNLKRWKIEGDSIELLDNCPVEFPITAITTNNAGDHIYVGEGTAILFELI